MICLGHRMSSRLTWRELGCSQLSCRRPSLHKAQVYSSWHMIRGEGKNAPSAPQNGAKLWHALRRDAPRLKRKQYPQWDDDRAYPKGKCIRCVAIWPGSNRTFARLCVHCALTQKVQLALHHLPLGEYCLLRCPTFGSIGRKLAVRLTTEIAKLHQSVSPVASPLPRDARCLAHGHSIVLYQVRFLLQIHPYCRLTSYLLGTVFRPVKNTRDCSQN